MIKRIIYFVESPFRKFDYKRYGIDILIQSGFEVVIWDFTKFLYQKVEQYSQDDLLTSNKIYKFSKLKDALLAIDKLTIEDIIIIHIGFSYKHLKIYRHLSKSKVFYLVTQLSNIPNGTIKKENYFVEKFKKALSQPGKVVDYVFTKIPFKMLLIREADFALSAGTKSKSNCYPIGKKTKNIWAHTYEYDQFLANKNLQSYYNIKKYCVFIDQNIPFHVDFKYDENAAICDPEEYYSKLESFFSYIESVLKMDVIIAMHPRSDIVILKKYFKERRITTGQIVEVIKLSSLVLAHYSTSILFAVLFSKPIMFVTNEFFIRHKEYAFISKFADELGKIPINIDHDYKIDLANELSVNLEKYTSYIEHYVKRKCSPQQFSTQILANYLKQVK